jgi:hypothetical protein
MTFAFAFVLALVLIFLLPLVKDVACFDLDKMKVLFDRGSMTALRIFFVFCKSSSDT